MMDHRKHPPTDTSRIDVSQDGEVRYWCREFHVTPDTLRDAVDKAGPLTDDVRAELGPLSERGQRNRRAAAVLTARAISGQSREVVDPL